MPFGSNINLGALVNLGTGGAVSVSTLALSLFFTTATATSGTVSADGVDLTFSRSSSATYWDADGVLQTASANIARVGADNRKPVTNLLTYPEQFDNAVWTNARTSESSGQSDPFGGTNAFKLVEDSSASTTHFLYRNTPVTVQAGKVYTFSCYAKAGERSKVRLFPSDTNSAFSATDYAQFDLSTETVETIGGTTYLGAGITAVEGATGWYRCWVTADCNTTAIAELRIFLAASSGASGHVYTGDGSSGLYIFGAMLNEGGIEDYIGATSLSGANDKAVGSWSQLGDTDSVTSNSAVAPDGTTTADTLADNNSTGSQFVQRSINVVLPEAGTYNYSCFFKANGLARALLIIQLYDSDAIADINLSTGATSGTASNIVAQYYGNGWYRLSCTFSTTTDLNGFLGVGPTQNGTNAAVDSDGTSSIYVWGHQVTRGSTLYPYVGMPQTGFTKQGYLAEAAATNLYTYSEALSASASSSYWSQFNLNSVTDNAVVAPDGTTTAEELIEDNTTNSHFLNRSMSVTSGTSYVVSFFAKAGARSRLSFYEGSVTGAQATFDLLAGTVVGTAGAGTPSAGIIPVGNGWHRCWMTWTASSTASVNVYIALARASDTSFASYLGDNASSLYLWGAQFETGTYPSSYIKTSGGTATRPIDDLSLPTSLTDSAAFLAYRDAFTIVAEYKRPSYTRFEGHVFRWLFDGGDYIQIYTAHTTLSEGVFAVTSDGSGALSDTTTLLNKYGIKTALAFAEDDFAMLSDGSSVVTDASTGVFETVGGSDFYIGSNGTNSMRGFLKSFQIYSERKSDADLAILSTITDDGTSWVDEKLAA